MPEKASDAFWTIGELAQDIGVPQHVLRYWETRFPHLRPLTRAGNRRYYRPADVELARKINRLLHQEGYTLRGVQQILQQKPIAGTPPTNDQHYAELVRIRDELRAALAPFSEDGLSPGRDSL